MCADPVSGQPLGRQPNRCPSVVGQAPGGTGEGDHCPFRHRRAGRGAAPDGGRRAGSGGRFRAPVAGFDLTFSPSKSVSTAWALADAETKTVIYDCHRRAIEVVLTYAEQEVFSSRSGTGGVVQEDIEGVVAAGFTHWDSSPGTPSSTTTWWCRIGPDRSPMARGGPSTAGPCSRTWSPFPSSTKGCSVTF